MTDPVAVLAASAPQAAAATSSPPTQFAPADTRMFASLMQGEPALDPAATATPGDVAHSLAAEFGNTRSFDEIRSSMLKAYDPRDPIKSMFTVASDGMEAQMLFSRLHIATSLASSATSLFGSLLKNQG
ncbi:MAG TPA: hypothetical protein VIN75_06525 [Burkholderiaceae bacterium]